MITVATSKIDKHVQIATINIKYAAFGVRMIWWVIFSNKPQNNQI